MSQETKHWTEIVKEAYEEGASDIEVCKLLGYTQARFDKELKENPQFRKFIDYGRTLAYAWWMEKSRSALYNKAFNTQMWAMVMKNRWGWSDKSNDLSEVPTSQLSAEELRSQAKEALVKMAKIFGPEITEADLLKKTSDG